MQDDTQDPNGRVGGTYSEDDFSPAAQRSRLRRDSLVDAGFQQSESSSLDAPTDAEGRRQTEQRNPDDPPPVVSSTDAD